MRDTLLGRLFPPPKFLLMPTFGIDISDDGIKTICFEITGRGLKLVNVSEHSIPDGLVAGGLIKQPEVLAGLLGDLAKAYNIKYATAAAPEDVAFIVNLDLPPVEPKEVREAVELQLEEHVPVKIADALFDLQVPREPSPVNAGWGVVVTTVGSPVAQSYVDTCLAAGVVLRSLEVESQALARALVRHNDRNTYMVVDFGRRRASFAVVSEGVVELATTAVSLGGDALTKTVQKNMNISFEEAERLKTTEGLLHTDKSSDLFFALMSHVSSLRDEINVRMDYWRNKKGGKKMPPVSQIILCGGQASLPGLIEYLTETIDIPVVLGNPWVNILDEHSEVPPLSQADSLRYALAIGLALRYLPHGH